MVEFRWYKIIAVVEIRWGYFIVAVNTPTKVKGQGKMAGKRDQRTINEVTTNYATITVISHPNINTLDQ